MLLPDPETTAEELLVGIGNCDLPIDVNKVVSSFAGIQITEEQLDGEGLFVDLGFQRAQILLNKNSNFTRKKFTLAHEIGHFMVREEAATRKTGKSNKQRDQIIEKWCNRFAGSLLMPRKAMLLHFRRAKISGILDALDQGPSKFGVSASAFRSRLVEIAPMSIFCFTKNKTGFSRNEIYLSDDIETFWKKEFNKILSQHVDYIPLVTKENGLMLVFGRSNSRDCERYFLVIKENTGRS